MRWSWVCCRRVETPPEDPRERVEVRLESSDPAQTYLYTLELQDQCWYVGTTATPGMRLANHRSGRGSVWTRAHPPMGGFASLEAVAGDEVDARLQEDLLVKRLMVNYGVDAVRGGSYSRERLSEGERAVLEREVWHATGACLRCGRQGHWATSCAADRDVSGRELPPPACRCGSTSHRRTNHRDCPLNRKAPRGEEEPAEVAVV